MYRCVCCIVPSDVLDRLAHNKQFGIEARKAAADTARLSQQMRLLRDEASKLTYVATARGGPEVQLAPKPKVSVFDCKQSQSLPGVPIASPKTSKDATAKRTFAQTTAVADFYKRAFQRNSIDDTGMTLMSSIHYGVRFNNAMWTGTQMVYGDGDGSLFLDFTASNDVIAHELAHGVTQHTLQLKYAGDAGGLNESLSDCFGAMFRQWQAKQDAAAADWLIGRDIMGPAAQAKGYVALRDMADPASKKALAPQPTLYAQITPGMDPHYSSGPPNLAFCTACLAIGGRSWETIGRVWYRAMTGFGASPSLTMPDFAARTRQVATQLFAGEPVVVAAVDAGWKKIGL
ncbi:MAG TPA: M4 family metallopeptidase [Methylibium sp.]|uniref:M4 family metallopeptidase n=1 Tax=Methylibium sp. TaxID=2067992 RepID=UPI002DB88753|nr:M4 family metallopeptidase [Methylibium sp.]HEU4460925.1 M4 family metallopeptidase [Methylibium sp.]